MKKESTQEVFETRCWLRAKTPVMGYNILSQAIRKIQILFISSFAYGVPGEDACQGSNLIFLHL